MTASIGEGLVLDGDQLTFNGKPVTALSTDLEGTVVDLEIYHHTAHALVASEVGVTIDLTDYKDTAARFPNFYGGPDIEVMKQIWAISDKELTIEQLLDLDLHIYREQLYNEETEINARPGAHEFFRALKEAHIPLAIGSVTDSNDARHIIEKANLTQYFDVIVLRDDVTNPKPHPDVYHETARRMGVTQGTHLILEDSRTGVRAAVAAREGLESPMVIALPVNVNDDVTNDLMSLGAHQINERWEGLLRINNVTEEGAQKNIGDGSLTHEPTSPNIES